VKTFRILFAFVLLLPLHALHAQITERALMSVNIPFAFTVENTRMPAGHYVIYSELGHEWKLASSIRGGNTFFHIYPTETPGLPARSKLIFRRYEKDYVLHEIDEGGTKIKATLPPGNRERQLLRGNAQPEIAMVDAQSGAQVGMRRE
jgi:hypothetical protein